MFKNGMKEIGIMKSYGWIEILVAFTASRFYQDVP